MKIYRVVPSSFLTNQKLDSTELTGVEDIYYKMGYSSFVGKRGFHAFNTMCDSIDKEGKYFYLFPEDAIMEGNNLIGNFHKLRANNFFVVEYDVPEELILKNIGYGDYTIDIMPWYIMETYISKTDLIGDITSTEVISLDKKTEYLVDGMNESLKIIKEFKDLEEIMYYNEVLGLPLFSISSLDSIINDKEKIKEILLDSNLYSSFLNENGQLIKTPYITGKIIPVNIGYISHEFRGWKNATEYFQSMDIRYDLSKEQNDFKEELIKSSQDKSIVKSLLKERKYI